MRNILVISVTVLFFRVGAQERYLDSLKVLLKNSKYDTVSCYLLSLLAAAAPEGEWQEYNRQLLEKTRAGISKPGIYENTRKYYEFHYAIAYSNCGIVAFQQGDIARALDHYHMSLYWNEKSGELEAAAEVLNNIAVIYMQQEQYVRALEYYNRLLAIFEKTKSERDLTKFLSNVGLLYYKTGEPDRALSYYEKALAIAKQKNNACNTANIYNHMGLIFKDRGQPALAEKKFKESIDLYQSCGDESGLPAPLSNLSDVYLSENKTAEAYKSASRALAIAKKLGYPNAVSNAAGALSEACKARGDFKQAFEYYRLKVLMRDSVMNEKNRKTAISRQLQYQFDKKAAADSIKNAEHLLVISLRHEHDIKQQRVYTYGGVLGFMLMMLVAGISLKAYHSKKRAHRVITLQKQEVEKQRNIIEHQKQLTELKQKEIIDSIHYAKRIQKAFLTSEKYIEKKMNYLAA